MRLNDIVETGSSSLSLTSTPKSSTDTRYPSRFSHTSYPRPSLRCRSTCLTHRLSRPLIGVTRGRGVSRQREWRG
jgi:hypothetical protein